VALRQENVNINMYYYLSRRSCLRRPYRESPRGERWFSIAMLLSKNEPNHQTLSSLRLIYRGTEESTHNVMKLDIPMTRLRAFFYRFIINGTHIHTPISATIDFLSSHCATRRVVEMRKAVLRKAKAGRQQISAPTTLRPSVRPPRAVERRESSPR
jgi:hypothetical protein